MSLRPQEKTAAELLQETEAVACVDVPEGSSSARVETAGMHQWVDKVEVGTPIATEARDGTADGGMLEGTP